MKTVLIVLGAPNTKTGELSAMAMSRLDCCLSQYVQGKHVVLCTGGWGDNFNVAPEPNAKYAKDYLISKGIPEWDFLDLALSRHTVEDAVKSKEILLKTPLRKVIVITSMFHLERAQLIFDEILKDYQVSYIAANDSCLNTGYLQKLKAHEKRAIQQLKENGLYY